MQLASEKNDLKANLNSLVRLPNQINKNPEECLKFASSKMHHVDAEH